MRGASDIRSSELEQQHRADRQVGPGEEPVLEGRQRPGALEQPFRRDQPDQDGDQDDDGVLQHRGAAAAEQGLHPDRQELLPPLAPHPPRQAIDATRLMPQGGDGLAILALGRGRGRRPVGRLDRQDRVESG